MLLNEDLLRASATLVSGSSHLDVNFSRFAGWSEERSRSF